jgi:hypothetical protein
MPNAVKISIAEIIVARVLLNILSPDSPKFRLCPRAIAIPAVDKDEYGEN